MARRTKTTELIYEKLIDLGNGLSIVKIHIDNLKEQTLNARVMTKEMMEQLAKTIGKRKYMESLPYCCKTGKGIEIISGHHRIRAARMAGIVEIHILLDSNNLTRDEITARQLAHNSISGYDDKSMLKRLFDQINDVDLKLETFIDHRELDIEVGNAIPILDIAPDLDFKSVHLLFLPNQLKKYDSVLKLITGDEKEIDVIPKEQFEDFKKTVMEIKKVNNIRSLGMAVSKMCDIVNDHFKAQNEP